MKKRAVSLVLAALLALTVCTGAALAYCQPETAAASVALYHGHGHHGGGHHGGGHGCGSHHDEPEDCDWLFHAYGKCVDVNCDKETHSHRCALDCDNAYHQHYGVCQYADGTLKLGKKQA